MSGERPLPLWPEGISKVRPVENQRRQPPPTGESSGVPKHGEGGGDARPNPKPLDNLELSTLKVLPRQREAGWSIKKPPPEREEPDSDTPETLEFCGIMEKGFLKRPLDSDKKG